MGTSHSGSSEARNAAAHYSGAAARRLYTGRRSYRLTAFRTFSSHDNFITSDAAGARSGSGRQVPRELRYFKPFEVFDHAAHIAHKVMVRVQECVVTGGIAIELELANQASLHQRMERVVDGGARGLRVAFIQRRKKIVDRSVVRMAQQIVENRDSLGRAPEASAAQSFIDIVTLFQFRHKSNIRSDSNVAQGLVFILGHPAERSPDSVLGPAHSGYGFCVNHQSAQSPRTTIDHRSNEASNAASQGGI